jgi:large subunit ribosomal protein L3
MNQIFGKKIGCTRVFTEGGESVPVTVLECTPNVICQVKTPESDGYSAVQVGLEEQKLQRLNKAAAGHQRKAEKGSFKFLSELRLDDHGQKANKSFNVGEAISLEGLFEAGKRVDVAGITVGKGFAGVVKRHGMKGNPATRGTHEYRRHGGSIGCRKTPGRTFKNKRMGGHMGVDLVTQLGLEVVQVRAEENLLLVRGSVPGPKNSYVYIRDAIKG